MNDTISDPQASQSVLQRRDFTFESAGERCAATLTSPAGPGPHPAVLIIHGFTCDRSMRLEPYVSALAAEGFVVMTYDPRHVGESAGEPRHLVDPNRLVDDATAALHALRSDPGTADFLAVLSFSFGGGIALSLTAADPGIDALAHVVGYVAPKQRSPEELARLFEVVGADLDAERTGATPVTIPVCGPPGSVAVLAGPDALAGRDLLDPSGASPNQTPARSLLGLASFSPAERAIDIGCPTLFVICDDDTIVDTNATLQLAAAIEGATTLTFRGSHFDVFQPTQAPGFARTVLEHFQTALIATADQT
jgi:alpha-beta hydrolase superfamily lysophospholipase